MAYPNPYELYKRVDIEFKKEEYNLLSTFPERPTSDEMNDAFLGKPRLAWSQNMSVSVDKPDYSVHLVDKTRDNMNMIHNCGL